MRGALTGAALNWSRGGNKWPRTHPTRFWILMVIYGSVVVVLIANVDIFFLRVACRLRRTILSRTGVRKISYAH